MREDHCKGHEEDREISIADYRSEQGCAEYDERNREWYQLILKKKSAGPTVGRPPQASLQLFFMASYDIDNFRRFVLSEGFRRTYVLPDGFYQEVEQDDEALLAFGYQFLRQVLFGERAIEEVANAWEQRVEGRKDVWQGPQAGGDRAPPGGGGQEVQGRRRCLLRRQRGLKGRAPWAEAGGCGDHEPAG